MKKLIILCLLMSVIQMIGQNTMTFDKNLEAPKATIEDFSWIAGHWKGEAFGGIVEEIWTPPLGDSMMCVFKLVNNDKTSFYEIVVLREENDTVILELKHFHPDLKGWEEKDETVAFPLVQFEKHKAYFDGFTFHRINEDELLIYVVISDNGEKQETKFHYYRANN